MLREIIRDFRIGRPQIFAGLLLLAFLVQCLWVAAERHFSEFEFQYLVSGYPSSVSQGLRVSSPFTGIMAALPQRAIQVLRRVLPARMSAALAVPRLWILRLPF